MSVSREFTRKALVKLVSERNSSLFSDPQFLKTALAKQGCTDTSLIEAILISLSEKIPWDLRKAQEAQTLFSALPGLRKKLSRNNAISDEKAQWILETWCHALGLPISAHPKAGPSSGSVMGVEYRLDKSGLIHVLEIWRAPPQANADDEIGLKSSLQRPPAKSPAPHLGGSRKKSDMGVRNQSNKAPKTQSKQERAGKLTKNESVKHSEANSNHKQTPEESFDMALALLSATGGTRNTAQAVELLHYAAGKGHAAAQYKLGEILLKGWDTKENIPEAIRLFALAASGGHIEAQLQMGTLYQCGLGVPIDSAQARRWFKLAADQGSEEAKTLLNQLNSSIITGSSL